MVAGHQVQSQAATRPLVKERTVGAERAWSITRYLQLPVLIFAAALLIGSIFLPYWNITLHAPQYPRGLYVEVFVNKMTPARNVFEVNGLNHYIGMMPLDDAAKIEREISRFAIPIVALLAVASFWLRGKWRVIARLPIMAYPVIFVADLFAWLYYAGHSLDPNRPLASIPEFTPRILGKGVIGQFSTQAHFDRGFFVAVVAAVLVLTITIWDRAQRNESAS